MELQVKGRCRCLSSRWAGLQDNGDVPIMFSTSGVSTGIGLLPVVALPPSLELVDRRTWQGCRAANAPKASLHLRCSSRQIFFQHLPGVSRRALLVRCRLSLSCRPPLLQRTVWP